jgi:hypothetical protein
MSIDWKLLAEARGDAIVKLEKHLSDAALVEAELREELAAIRATTVEECAKVCDDALGDYARADELGDAIRALLRTHDTRMV